MEIQKPAETYKTEICAVIILTAGLASKLKTHSSYKCWYNRIRWQYFVKFSLEI